LARRADGRGRIQAARSARAGRAVVAPTAGRFRTRLTRRLGALLGEVVELELTDNTYTMISFSRRGLGYRVRLHHMFTLADEDVLQRLAGYIRGDDRRASSTLDTYIHDHRRLIRQMSPVQRQRRLMLQTEGRTHDLTELLDDVRLEFRQRLGDEAHDVAIAWAPAPSVQLPRRSIKLGSYSADTQIIRIHPALDQPPVPRYFIRWIIFHELLHHRFRADLKARTGRIHTPEFCRLERAFPDYRPAIAWERRHLDLLLWWDSALHNLLRAG
jgi:hypothetical protein